MSSDSVPDTTSGKGEGQPEAEPEVPSACEASAGERSLPAESQRCNALLLSFASLCLIVFGVWVVSAGKRYREEYAQVTEGWRVGSVRMVELTLVKEDRHNLACASDQVIAGLHCGYRRNGHESGPVSPQDPKLLQPYNTVGNELLLGAGLWSSPDLKDPLPQQRFSAVCNYHIEGVTKSAGIRFDPKGSFSPIGRTVTAGTLRDCVIPR